MTPGDDGCTRWRRSCSTAVGLALEIYDTIDSKDGRIRPLTSGLTPRLNRNIEGRDVLRVLGYYGSAVKYRRITEKVAAKGYPGFQLD